MISIVNTVSFFCDFLFSVFYLKLCDLKNKIPFSQRILACLCLACSVLLYHTGLIPLFSNSWIRYLYRALITCGCLLTLGRLSPSVSVYGGIFWSTVCTLCHNIFLAPATSSLFLGTASFGFSPMIDQIICALLLTNFKLPCYLFVWYFNPIDALGRMRPVKGSIMMAVTSISIFMKEIQTVHMNGSRDTLWEQSLYFILLQIALFLFLNLWEQYQRKRAENVALSLQEVATKSLLKNIQARQEHDESIRQLRHDLKNHLLTLHLLLEKGDTDAASQYVETFLDQVSVKRFSPQTGHELLDGVLAEKLDSAISQGIQVSVNLDFRKGGFIQNFDLCTVMGNVLDNAVESALKAVSRQDRFIDIRGGYSAGCLVIHISNGFLIPPVMTGHLPCTTKENPGRHGFGLRNVEQTLKKYGGSFNISVEDGNRFVLAMLIPVPVEE